jgi:hypothetical protein
VKGTTTLFTNDVVRPVFRGAKNIRFIEGHEKGLTLSPEDRKALIAFLKTI